MSANTALTEIVNWLGGLDIPTAEHDRILGLLESVDLATQAMAEELKEARRVIERYADEERTTFSPQSARIAQDYLSKYPKETE